MIYTEWSEDLERALAEPFPREMHERIKAAGSPVYVKLPQYMARLNALVGVGGWSMERPETYHAGSKFGVCIGLTILGVTKWNVGDEMEDHGEPDDDNVVRDFGSSSTNSFAQAFKRCCAYGFGLGLYLYDKEFTRRYLATSQPAQNGQRSSNAQGNGNGSVPRTATANQMSALRRMAVKADGTDPKVVELRAALEAGQTFSAQVASQWIGYLKSATVA